MTDPLQRIREVCAHKYNEPCEQIVEAVTGDFQFSKLSSLSVYGMNISMARTLKAHTMHAQLIFMLTPMSSELSHTQQS